VTDVTKHGICNYWVMDFFLSSFYTMFVKQNTRNPIRQKGSEKILCNACPDILWPAPGSDPGITRIQTGSIFAWSNLLTLKWVCFQQFSLQILTYDMALYMSLHLRCSVCVPCTYLSRPSSVGTTFGGFKCAERNSLVELQRAATGTWNVSASVTPAIPTKKQGKWYTT
jgi:hypothetical protein